MLSRLTHAVLVLAVVVLTIALVRSHRDTRVSKSIEDATIAERALVHVDAASSNEASLLAAALTSFDVMNVSFAQSGTGGGQGAGTSEGAASAQSDRGDRPGGRGSRSMPAFTEEMAARCIEVAAEVDPDLAARLSEAREKNPQEFEDQMRAGGFGRRLWALAQLKTHDPRLYNDKIAELAVAVQIDRAAKSVRDLRSLANVSISDLQSAENKLHALLQVQVALSIKARGDMLCRFEDRARELHAELDREARNFQSTVEARMTALTAVQREEDREPAAGASETKPNGG